MVDKPHNYLLYKYDRVEHNVKFSALYTETLEEEPQRIPKKGNENLFDELGDDYSKVYCHVITIEYSEQDRNGEINEIYGDRTIRHFIPCDSDTEKDNQVAFHAKRADYIISDTDNTKFINKDQIALVGYDRTI